MMNQLVRTKRNCFFLLLYSLSRTASQRNRTSFYTKSGAQRNHCFCFVWKEGGEGGEVGQPYRTMPTQTHKVIHSAAKLKIA